MFMLECRNKISRLNLQTHRDNVPIDVGGDVNNVGVGRRQQLINQVGGGGR
jgi:hypothetical protein